tara:strand:- start:835 stop:1047 length:213 start_codon:yes stop_codon:yes gene_type:complete
MTEYEKSMLKSNYDSAFERAKSEVRAIKSGSTGHTRPDVALNQIEHGMALQRSELVNAGINASYFRHSDY